MEYKEIFKLKAMLEEAKIPFTFTDDFFGTKGSNKVDLFGKKFYPAYNITINENLDVIEHCGSYGNEQDLLEIMGGMTIEEQNENGSVFGHLTAEEVFKRFKYCYENGTSIYTAEEKESNSVHFDEKKNLSKMENQYTVIQTAKILGVSIRTLRYMISNGKIVAKKYEGGRKWYIAQSEIERVQSNMR